MFKSFIIVCGTITFLQSASIAQSADSNLTPSSQYNASLNGERSSAYKIDLSTNAVRNFNEEFKEARGEKWSKKPDGYRVSFQQEDVRYLVDYDKKGNWRSTIRIYGENKLPEDVRELVKTNFFDYSIVTVSELKLNKVLSYFVKLEDPKSLKTVRVINGQLEIVEDYVK